jgi:protein-tyrosine phosphatase
MMTRDDRIGVLFVCHANMCRSPLAEGVFAHLVAQRGLGSRFQIDSAGTWASEGVRPHPHSVDVGLEHGVDLLALTSCSSRPLRPDDLARFDHVIAMDRANESDIERLQRISAFGAVEGKVARVRLLRAIVDPQARGSDRDVPDPIGRGPDAYARVYGIVEAACEALLDELTGP